MDFEVPSVVPQDLLLIQDLLGTFPPPTVTTKCVLESLDSSDNSIASTDDEAESEDEVEANLVPRDEDNMLAAASDSALHSDSESDASSPSDSEGDCEAPQPQRPADDIDDEEPGTMTTTHLQTKNEILDSNITIPNISEVDLCDTLEKVGEIMSIVGNIVIVRGLPVDSLKSLSEHALDADSLLVFEDRKVFGHVYETFGPTSQPLYQVKFNEHYPLDTDKVWLSREVFHIPQRSQFVFVDQLKNLRGSDASNIHDEEPADDEIEFSDDEKEAAFKALRKRRRQHSLSSGGHSTLASSRIHIDDMVQDTYHGSNPYDAHGPYDDDYHVIEPSRPSPAPYDDPYADFPTSDIRIPPSELHGGFGGEPDGECGRDGVKGFRGHTFSRGARGGGTRNRQLRNTSRRGYRNNAVGSRRHGEIADVIVSHPFTHPSSNAWLPPETDHISNFQQSFIQPHINPRFAPMFGLNLPSGSMVPWGSQNADNHASPSLHWSDRWTMHGSAGSEGEGDTYRPM